MLNFPLPYTDELIYSVVGRAGIHMGITSPKQLLDAVFGSRAMVATVDLPNQLDKLRKLYPSGLGYTVERLAYEHTLFPIYAPFTIESRRDECIKKMATNSQGTIHLMLGVAASRLKQPKYLRYCPFCLARQFLEHGEYYWLRQWQIIGADCCLEHGRLIESRIGRHEYHRHQFFPASPAICPSSPQTPAEPSAIKVALQVLRLLKLQYKHVATFAQWSQYYHQLAATAGCVKSARVDHDSVRERVLTRWPMNWLETHGLALPEMEATWLHAIFRKHRKSFSYLEHIVALDSLLPSNWLIEDVLAEVLSIKSSSFLPVTNVSASDEKLTEQITRARSHWLATLKLDTIKCARSKNRALYAWLYRHDRGWLLSVNLELRQPRANKSLRIDWRTRDRYTCRQLIKIRNESKSLLDSHKRSRNWYLSILDKPDSIEKNIHKMPLTALFFKRHCEDVADYQIRRLVRALHCLEVKPKMRWELLRRAGLSDERLTGRARFFLCQIMED